jgi:prepilin-type N-terminal cleavage/methylation domain-containing protein
MNGHRRAFTLVELLVVIAIIGILVSLLLPAIQASRESARRAMCSNNFRQIILAVHDYENAHEHYPAGTVNDAGPIRNVPKGHHISWIARILPYLEEKALFANLDLSLSAYHHKNDAARQTVISTLLCPSNPSSDEPYSSYVGCHHDVEAPIDADNRGVFFLNSRLTRDDIKDGAAYTLFIGEKLIEDSDLGWLSGTPATLRNTGSPLNRLNSNSGWTAGSLQWLYSYERESGDWAWSNEQLDPITGETLQLNPETGVYEPAEGIPAAEVDETPPTGVAAAPTEGEPQPNNDASEPTGNDSPPNELIAELGAKPELKPDANGLFPHSRLGGDPAKPLAVGGFSSRHADGVLFALGDGSVRFIADDVSASLMGRLANRADGTTVDAREW